MDEVSLLELILTQAAVLVALIGTIWRTWIAPAQKDRREAHDRHAAERLEFETWRGAEGERVKTIQRDIGRTRELNVKLLAELKSLTAVTTTVQALMTSTEARADSQAKEQHDIKEKLDNLIERVTRLEAHHEHVN